MFLEKNQDSGFGSENLFLLREKGPRIKPHLQHFGMKALPHLDTPMGEKHRPILVYPDKGRALVEQRERDTGGKLGGQDGNAASYMRIPRIRIEGHDRFPLFCIVAHHEAFFEASQDVVIRYSGGAVMQQVAGTGDVSSANLHRIHAQLVGNSLNNILDDKCPFGPTKSSEGRIGGQIGSAGYSPTGLRIRSILALIWIQRNRIYQIRIQN